MQSCETSTPASLPRTSSLSSSSRSGESVSACLTPNWSRTRMRSLAARSFSSTLADTRSVREPGPRCGLATHRAVGETREGRTAPTRPRPGSGLLGLEHRDRVAVGVLEPGSAADAGRGDDVVDGSEGLGVVLLEL